MGKIASFFAKLVLPPWLSVPLAFIKAYWKPLLIIAVAIGLFWSGYTHGHDSAKAQYDKTLRLAAEKAQQEHDRLQAALDKAAADFEAYRAKTDQLLDDAESELNHEIATNPAYSTCRVGPDFVRAYTKLAAGHP